MGEQASAIHASEVPLDVHKALATVCELRTLITESEVEFWVVAEEIVLVRVDPVELDSVDADTFVPSAPRLN